MPSVIFEQLAATIIFTDFLVTKGTRTGCDSYYGRMLVCCLCDLQLPCHEFADHQNAMFTVGFMLSRSANVLLKNRNG